MNLVEGTWTCECGAWNAAYRTDCGKCGKPKPKKDEQLVLQRNGQQK